VKKHYIDFQTTREIAVADTARLNEFLHHT